MKKIILCATVLITLIFVGSVYAQSNVKNWVETTVQDFSDNQITNLVVTNNSGGEVKLSHPLIQKVADYCDDSALRNISKDSSGNYIRTWVASGNIYVQKYSAFGGEESPILQANEIEHSIGEFILYAGALNDNGTYLVVWINTDADADSNLCGQLFKDDSVKSGANFVIKHSGEYCVNYIEVMWNKLDNNFWVFFTKEINEKFKIHIQRVDDSGDCIGGMLQLNQENIRNYELQMQVIPAKYYFWATWGGAEIDVSDDFDIFLRKYYYDGTAAGDAVIVNDEISRTQLCSSLNLDEQENLLVAWLDDRDAVEPIYGPQFNIYGQVFRSDGTRLGENIRLNSTYINGASYREIDIININNEFQVSWSRYDEHVLRYRIYASIWELYPTYWGEMISSVFRADPDSAYFEKIEWNEISVPQTEIKFKIRTGRSIEQLNNSVWYGPTDTSGHYLISGSTVNPIHNGDCYIQYKALFSSLYGNSSLLNAVAVAYTPEDIIPPAPPSNLAATASYHKINLSWQSNDQNDLLEYIIYRGTVSGYYDSIWKTVIPANSKFFTDTTLAVATRYYYVVTAIDSSHNESSYSNEVSAIANGINIYVSSAATPNGDGSVNNPFLTIQQGISAAVPGDTVNVLPGNYDQSFKMKNKVSLIGTKAEECKLNAKISATDSCIIKGFTITKSLSCLNGSPLIVENIFIGTSPMTAAISLDAPCSPIISRNFITECERGIAMTFECNPLIMNNIINAQVDGIRMELSDTSVIINNTVIAKRYRALNLNPWDTHTIFNNIFVTLDSIAEAYPSNYKVPPLILKNNDFWNSYQVGTQVPPENIFLNPQFENIELQNFHLLSTSPCIDAGNPDPTYNDVDGSRNDMGAYGGPNPLDPDLFLKLIKSLSVSNLTGYPQDTITVFISLDVLEGLSRADFIFEYNPLLLEFVRAELTLATQHFNLVQQILYNGELKFSLSSGVPIENSDNEILKIKFLVNAGAKSGESSQLILKNVSLWDAGLRNILLRSITDGVFIVNKIEDNENYIHVDAQYRGPERGSREQPYNTIMEAVTAAKMGDSVLVNGGIYYETVVMKEGIAVIGSGASVTSIIVGVEQQSGVVFDSIAWGEISGFTIRATGFHNPALPLINCTSSSPLIKKNHLGAEFGQASGVFCCSNSNAVIESNYIKEMGIVITGSNAIIRNNVMEDFTMFGIICDENSTTEIAYNKMAVNFGDAAVRLMNGSNAIFRNNLINCSTGAGLILNNAINCLICNNIIVGRGFGNDGIFIENSSGNLIINNSIVTHNKGIVEPSSTSTILNNLILDNSEFGVKFSPASNFDYNDVWNNNVNYYETTPGVHDLSADPMFADTAKGDYRLAENSPCVDAGHPDAAYNDPDGSRNDMGAYGGPNADYDWLPFSSGALTIDSVSSMSTDTIVVTIAGKGLEDIIEFDFSLSYDKSLLTAVNANNVELTRSFSLQKDFDTPGLLNLCLQSKSGSCDQDGELVKMYFVSQAQQSVDTWIRFDSIKVKDEATYLRRINNFSNGKIRIMLTGMQNLVDASVPRAFKLYQNYPNPFNPTTTIKYEIPRASKVTLKIFDILGREITTLFKGNQKAGKYEVEWRATKFSSGIYFYRLQAGEFLDTRKLILLK